MRQNCWEKLNCGRQPGGQHVKEFGVCPAATEERVDGINSGKNGGRSCWAITGTLCGGTVQGSFATKLGNCMNCDFFKTVWKEENSTESYSQTVEILRKLNRLD